MRPETLRDGAVALVQLVDGCVYECWSLRKGAAAVEARCFRRSVHGDGYAYGNESVSTWPWREVRRVVERP